MESKQYRPPGGPCRFDDVAGIYVYVVFLILAVIVSVIENLLVIIVLFKNKQLQKPSNILLGILACIDLITGAVIIPLKIWVMLEEKRSSNFTSDLVLLLTISAVVLFTMSTVVFISLDQVLNIVYMQRYHLSKAKMILGLMLTWCIPIAVCFAIGFFYQAILAVPIFFLLSILLMVFLHIFAAYRLKRQADVREHADVDENVLQEQRNGLTTTLLLSVACVATYFPIFLGVALYIGGIYSNVYCGISLYALLASSFINPLIYIWRVPNMKRSVIGLFKRSNIEEEDTHRIVALEGRVACQK